MKKQTKSKDPISLESQQEAMKMAKAVQKPGQTKEQTKIIAQGIEKGITLYKKQQKERSREADKLKKKKLRQKQSITDQQISEDQTPSRNKNSGVFAWILLVLSWAYFVYYAMVIKAG